MPKFRSLTADEIEVRVSTVSEKGCSLLLYKDARCDMNILDETVGAENWQRSHVLINDNLFCNVSIKCDGEWVSKQDVGTESYTEKEKGQASDSFKRACFNWGIGRELYTAPFIWIGNDKCKIEKRNGKDTTYDKFKVADIEIENGKITKLSIANARTGAICYQWKKPVSSGGDKKADKPSGSQLTEKSKEALNTAISTYKELTGENINAVMSKLKNAVGKPHTEYTEADAKKALEVLSKMQAEHTKAIGA